MDRTTRLERLARWYAEAFQSLNSVERQIDEVLQRLGLTPAEGTATPPAANGELPSPVEMPAFVNGSQNAQPQRGAQRHA